MVEEGSKGIFGLGVKEAKVRVSFNEEKIENVKSGEYIVIEKSEKSATFLRRRTSNFYKKL